MLLCNSEVKFNTFQLIGDRGDVVSGELQSLVAIELGLTENVVVLNIDAFQSRGLESLRQGEAEERRRDLGVGEVEDVSSGQGDVGVGDREVHGSQVTAVKDR